MIMVFITSPYWGRGGGICGTYRTLREMSAKFRSLSLKGRIHLIDLSVNGDIFKMGIKEVYCVLNVFGLWWVTAIGCIRCEESAGRLSNR